jgi:hypothetical protein
MWTPSNLNPRCKACSHHTDKCKCADDNKSLRQTQYLRLAYPISPSASLLNDRIITFGSRGLYRWKSDRDKVHYFVEFMQAESVNRARGSKLNVPDTHVHALAYIPQLIDRFCALAGAAGDPVSDLKRSRSSSPRRASTTRARRTSPPRSRGASPHTPVASCPGFGDPDFSLRAPGSNKRKSSGGGRSSAINYETRFRTSEHSPIPITLSDSSIAVNSEPASRTGRHILNLTICDQPITIDLDGMEDDPKGIISLLELSTCERDKWIIAAAHYRRGGNPIAAIEVLTSMMKGDPLSHLPLQFVLSRFKL